MGIGARDRTARGTKLPDKTFDEAMKRYEAEVATRAGSRWRSASCAEAGT